MAFTPKQERNGTDQGADGHNSAVANMADMVEMPVAEAMAAAQVAQEGAHELWVSPAGAGVDGHSIGPAGPMFEWDSGLAISEMPRGAVMSDVFGTIGNGLSMAGNLESTAEATAEIAAMMAVATAILPGQEAAAAAFIQEYGAEVLDGHGMVDKPTGDSGPDYND